MRRGSHARSLRALWLVPIVTCAAVASLHGTQDVNAAPLRGTLVVCKSAANGMAAYSFNFTVDGAAIPAVRGGHCSAPLALAPGNHLVTEAATPSFQVSAITVSPQSALISQNRSLGRARVAVISNAETLITYRNKGFSQGPGTLEICKKAADAQTSGKPFNFSVDGGPAITVIAGQCSPPMAAPTTTRILEEATANFHVASVTATGPDGSNRRLSGPTDNPATVSVPFGGVANETLVTFTDAANTGLLKICKTSTATADGSGILLGGLTFSYIYSYVVDNVYYSGTTTLTLPSGGQPGVTVCTGLFDTQSDEDGIPVVDSSGNEVPVTVTERQNHSTVHVLSSGYQGNGDDFAANTITGVSSFDIGFGVNIVTYDNEP